MIHPLKCVTVVALCIEFNYFSAHPNCGNLISRVEFKKIQIITFVLQYLIMCTISRNKKSNLLIKCQNISEREFQYSFYLIYLIVFKICYVKQRSD